MLVNTCARTSRKTANLSAEVTAFGNLESESMTLYLGNLSFYCYVVGQHAEREGERERRREGGIGDKIQSFRFNAGDLHE